MTPRPQHMNFLSMVGGGAGQRPHLHVESKPLELLQVTAAIVGAPTVKYFTVNNPSSLLTVGFEVGFSPDIPTEVADFGSSSWSPVAMARGLTAGLVYLHPLDGGVRTAAPIPSTGQPLPRSYEGATQVKAIRVKCNFYDALAADLSAVTGSWFARAYWDLNVPILDEEADRLLSQCSLLQG